MDNRRSLKDEAHQRLKAVEGMLRQWDPIGVFVSGVEGPLDEYDSYAPALLRALRDGDTVAELAQHLAVIRIELMGLPENREADLRTARQLHSWWQERGLAQ